MPIFLIRWSAEHRFLVIGICAALAALGCWSLPQQHVDAVPDTSDTQVILYAEWDQPPSLVEGQVTYPLTAALLGAPKVTAVRGFTNAGFALLYVLFEDGTDLYWARSRVAELLSKAAPTLPAGARVDMGPDATSVGWIFQYALVDDSGRRSLADLRALQDWSLRNTLAAVPGVAEVATIGGFEKEFQVTVQPAALEQYNVPFKAVVEAVRNSTRDTGGRQIEFSGRTAMVRGRGLAHTIEDLERAVVYAMRAPTDMTAGSVPLLLRDIARIEAVPGSRQGVSDWNGTGEAVGGIVIMRHGQNALEVIRRVTERIEAVRPSLPQGIRIVTTYDRSELIRRAVATLRRELLLAACVVSLVIFWFLRQWRPALVAVTMIPITLMIALLPIFWFGVDVNIMSLAGLVLSIGVLVDGVMIELESIHRRVSLNGNWKGEILAGLEEVAPAVFLSLLTITVTFAPTFALTGQERRLFQPLAAAKTIAMATAALLTLTLAPALCMVLRGGNAVPPQRRRHFLSTMYERVVRIVLRFPKTTIGCAILIVAATVPVYLRLGHEFMPPLNEETALFMPTTLPGISPAQAEEVLRRQDAALASLPEVARVYGKAGRAQTATDPAPLSMMETIVTLKPAAQWRSRRVWYSGWAPDWLKVLLRHVTSDRISYEELIAEMDRVVRLPGVVNSWTMPIRGRTDMLTTGARTAIAVKVLGPDLKTTEDVSRQVEAVLRRNPRTRAVFAERAAEGQFIDIELDRDRLANRGLQVGDVQDTIEGAVGGVAAAQLFAGRERYPVTVRYPKQFRDSPEKIGRIAVWNENGEWVPLDQIADIRRVRDTDMLRTENGMLASYVFVDAASGDIGTYVDEARRAVAQRVALPAGCSIQWSGEYENMMRARERLRIVIPVTLLSLLLLLYLNTRSWIKTGLVVLAVPFSLVGAVWLLYALGYNISVATWVGMIALVGLDAETGVFMLLFLDLAYEESSREGLLERPGGLADAVVNGAAKRLRPKLMTVAAAFLGLLPAMLSAGTGSDLIKRIVAPMVGGLAASFVLELLVYPPLYFLWRRHGRVRFDRAAGMGGVGRARILRNEF
jgi:Cu(I)/Ag(I) efflux system membrane protein CusA/SilA